MRRLLPSLAALGTLLLLASTARAATAEPTSSAWQWLGLLDGGKYAESWAEGSALFRERITERAWEGKIQIFRDAVGTIVWRDVLDVATVAELPNMPNGQYAVVHYRSKFSGKAECEETVSMVLEDGLWRVASYTIK